MLNYFLIILFVIVSQIIFNYLRTIEIKFMIKDMIKETMIVSFFISITILTSTFISFKALLEGDYLIAVIFIISGLFGKYLGLKEYKMEWMSRFFEFKKKKRNKRKKD
jgi:hypothetical protein